MALPLILQALAGGLLGQYGANKLNDWQSAGTRSTLLGQPPMNVMDSMPPVGPPTATGQEAAREHYMQQVPGQGLLSMFPPEAAPLLQGQSTGSLQNIAAALLNPEQPKQTSLMQNLAAAGMQPGTPEYRKAILDNLSRSQVSVNMGNEPPYKIPVGYMMIDPTDPSKGIRPIPGANEDYSRTQDWGKAVEPMQTLEQALARYEKALDENGAELLNPNIRADLQSKHTALMIQMKELFNLGVLQGPDMEIMERALPDPTSLSAKVQEMWGSLSGGNPLKNGIATARATMKDKIRALEQRFGRKYQSAPDPADATGSTVPQRRPGETPQQYLDRVGR